jgi:Mor family transcriptional regulator
MELYTQWIFAVVPPELHATIAEKKASFCQEYGGQRYFLPKGTKRTLTPQQRQAVYDDGLTAMDNDQIIEKHKISRRTLYRVMKGGGGRFG